MIALSLFVLAECANPPRMLLKPKDLERRIRLSPKKCREQLARKVEEQSNLCGICEHPMGDGTFEWLAPTGSHQAPRYGWRQPERFRLQHPSSALGLQQQQGQQAYMNVVIVLYVIVGMLTFLWVHDDLVREFQDPIVSVVVLTMAWPMVVIPAVLKAYQCSSID